MLFTSAVWSLVELIQPCINLIQVSIGGLALTDSVFGSRLSPASSLRCGAMNERN